VPGKGQKTVRVKARGREQSVSFEEDFPDRDEPLLIRFDRLED
jgi:hypothetical protein